MCCGDSVAAAISLVARSRATTVISVPQNRGGLDLPLSIFFALLALDAISRVRQRVEPFESDLSPAVVALPELLRIPVQPAQRLVYVPEKTAFLTREQKRFLALHRIGTLVGHVKGVCAQIAVRTLGRRTECLVVMAELLENALPLFHEALLEVLQALFWHRLRLFTASCCCHL